MYTQTSTKLAALAVALFVNGLMLGSIAYLFNGELRGTGSMVTAVRSLLSAPALAKI